MIYIDKRGKEPANFILWKQRHDVKLKALYADPKITGNTVWKYLDEHRAIYNKRKLKSVLVQEQGSICCYCGKRLLDEYYHHITIEHLEVKTVNKELTYDYSNLLASCSGGAKVEIHVVKYGETKASIAQEYGVSEDHLQNAYILTQDKERFNRVYNIDLKAGDRIVIVPLVAGKQQHCNLRRGDDPISLHPLMPNVAQHFGFDKATGKIKITLKNKLSVENLGLNDNEILNEDRKHVLDQAILLRQMLVQKFGNDIDLFNEKRKILISKYKNIDPETGTYSPFPFVSIAILEGR